MKNSRAKARSAAPRGCSQRSCSTPSSPSPSACRLPAVGRLLNLLQERSQRRDPGEIASSVSRKPKRSCSSMARLIHSNESRPRSSSGLVSRVRRRALEALLQPRPDLVGRRALEQRPILVRKRRLLDRATGGLRPVVEVGQQVPAQLADLGSRQRLRGQGEIGDALVGRQLLPVALDLAAEAAGAGGRPSRPPARPAARSGPPGGRRDRARRAPGSDRSCRRPPRRPREKCSCRPRRRSSPCCGRR